MCVGRRHHLRLLAVSFLVAIGFPESVPAQANAAAAWRGTPASQLKTTLRSVVAAQTRYHAEKKTYAAAMQPLRLRPEAGIRVDVLAAGPHGWQAKAVHRDQPGRSCVIFVGKVDGADAPMTDGDREMAGEEGVPLCDRMR